MEDPFRGWRSEHVCEAGNGRRCEASDPRKRSKPAGSRQAQLGSMRSTRARSRRDAPECTPTPMRERLGTRRDGAAGSRAQHAAEGDGGAARTGADTAAWRERRHSCGGLCMAQCGNRWTAKPTPATHGVQRRRADALTSEARSAVARTHGRRRYRGVRRMRRAGRTIARSERRLALGSAVEIGAERRLERKARPRSGTPKSFDVR